MRTYLIVLLVIAGFLCSGFRHTGPLKSYPTNPKNMQDFNATKFKKGQKIRLVNAQTSTKDFLIIKEPKGNQVEITQDLETTLVSSEDAIRHEDPVEWEELVGNEKSWTETAISLVKSELEKKGFIISEDAKKELRLAITSNIQVIPVMFLTRCILYLKVETGNGYLKEYEGNSFSMDHVAEVMAGAIPLSVENMLNDNKILVYLKDKESVKQVAPIRPDPSDAKANLKAGIGRYELGQFNGAIKSFKQAIALKPGWARAHYRLGLAYLKANNQEAAFEQYEILKDLDSNFANKLFADIYE